MPPISSLMTACLRPKADEAPPAATSVAGPARRHASATSADRTTRSAEPTTEDLRSAAKGSGGAAKLSNDYLSRSHAADRKVLAEWKPSAAERSRPPRHIAEIQQRNGERLRRGLTQPPGPRPFIRAQRFLDAGTAAPRALQRRSVDGPLTDSAADLQNAGTHAEGPLRRALSAEAPKPIMPTHA